MCVCVCVHALYVCAKGGKGGVVERVRFQYKSEGMGDL